MKVTMQKFKISVNKKIPKARKINENRRCPALGQPAQHNTQNRYEFQNRNCPYLNQILPTEGSLYDHLQIMVIFYQLLKLPEVEAPFKFVIFLEQCTFGIKNLHPVTAAGMKKSHSLSQRWLCKVILAL